MQPNAFASDYWWKNINTKPGAMVVLETELQQPIGFVHFPERIERLVVDKQIENTESLK